MARKKGLWLDIADWRRMTAGLLPEEKGAYVELLITCIENDGRLDNDSQSLRICSGLLARIWNVYLRRLMPKLFYQAPDGCWRSKIIDFQIERAEKTSEERSAAGRAGSDARWHKPSQTDDKPIANAINEHGKPMAFETIKDESVNRSSPNGEIASPPLVPPSRAKGGKRARRLYQPSPRTVQTEAFLHAADDLERSRNR